MTEQSTRLTAVAVGVFAGALTLANVILMVLGREALDNADGDLVFDVVITIGVVFYIAIGLLIAVRARNLIGWFLVAVGISYGLVTFSNTYAAVGLVTHPVLFTLTRRRSGFESLSTHHQSRWSGSLLRDVVFAR